MPKKVWIIDTNVLSLWLDIPKKNSPQNINGITWNKTYVRNLICKAENITFVLPLATLIETGNHIAGINGQKRYYLAQELANILTKAIDEESPWAAFTEQYNLWETDNLKKLAEEWPSLAVQGLSMGDITIKWVAEYYSGIGYHVETLTLDKGLKSYEPIAKTKKIPRRRRNY